jgi:O-antigen ligase
VEEINAYYSGSKNTSVGRRLYMWEGAFKMILENPLLGVGTGGYQRALAQYRDDPSLPDIIHPHNTFLYVASSYGIVGLLSFSWLFIIFLKKGWSARETIEGFASLSYGAVLLIGSLTDTQILSVSTGILFALLTGLRTKQNE